MGRKRKALKLLCYYCGRDFVDEQTLILHQRAKHFRCGSCDRQLPNIADLVWHAQKKHGEAVLKASVADGKGSFPRILTSSPVIRCPIACPAGTTRASPLWA